MRLSYLWLVDITEEIGSHYAKNSLKTIKLATPMHLPTMRSSTSASAVCSRLPRKRKSKWATLTFHSSGEPLNLAYICFTASYVMSNLRHRNLLHLLLLSQMCTTNICEHNSLTTYTSLMFVRCLYRVLPSQKMLSPFPQKSVDDQEKIRLIADFPGCGYCLEFHSISGQCCLVGQLTCNNPASIMFS